MAPEYDVIIGGGGPAGSTAATLLAQYGYRILLIEAGRHPRFHIGESMLPASEPVMERLGIDWSNGNQFKQGADFMDETSQKSLYIRLSDSRRNAFQIERSVFDQALFENAVAHGVTARQNEKVLHFRTTQDTVQIGTDQNRYSGRYFIDATGRSSISGRKSRSITELNGFGRYALFQHYSLAATGLTDELFATGNIKIILVDIGWIWAIPLVRGRLSLGLVVKDDSRPSLKGSGLLRRYIGSSPYLSKLLEDAKPISKIMVEADYSYVNKNRHGFRFICCGDAAGFLDPVFSSGFFFAVKSAEWAADRLHRAFTEGREGDPHLHQEDSNVYDTGFQTMYGLIYRFYQSSMIENLIFESGRHERIKAEISALLAGDLWNHNNRFQQGLLSGRNSFTNHLFNRFPNDQKRYANGDSKRL